MKFRFTPVYALGKQYVEFGPALLVRLCLESQAMPWNFIKKAIKLQNLLQILRKL